jgi:hypothetical protein
VQLAAEMRAEVATMKVTATNFFLTPACQNLVKIAFGISYTLSKA